MKTGDIRSDGFIRMGGRWCSPPAAHRHRISTALNQARIRARERHLPFDLTIDYLVSIYPADNRCPILGLELCWGNPRHNSPSLDRISPAHGYVIGNVTWMSQRANAMKSDASSEELLMFADWIRNTHDVALKH